MLTSSSDEPSCRRQGVVQYRIARTPLERAGAFRLTYESYVSAGLMKPNAARMRVTPHQLLPTTDIFVATDRGEVVCTTSVVADGRAGVPMEAIYPEQVDCRRARGVAFGEVSGLADRRRDMQRFLPLFLRLCELLLQCARYRGLDELLIAVHPRHARAYQRLFGFELIGQERIYPNVGHHPAVALRLEYDTLKEQHPSAYQRIFGRPLPVEAFAPAPALAASELQRLQQLADGCGKIGSVIQTAAESSLERPDSESPLLAAI